MHADVKDLPQMSEESSRQYLFIGIYRAHALGLPINHGVRSETTGFLRRLKKTAPHSRAERC